MKVVIDGNDGTGKSTLVEGLKKLGYKVTDRGLPTKLTDNSDLPVPNDEIYIILDAPVETCQARLNSAGKSLKEKYHTKEDLLYYRDRFKKIADELKNAHLIDASASISKVLAEAISVIQKYK